MVICKTMTFSNGVQMPMVGLGTWQASPQEVKASVHAALRAGYRMIDTAYCYANEEAIGEALKEAMSAGIKREDLFVVTKAWPTHLHPALLEEHFMESLKKLKLEYVDLYLAHMPAAFDKTDFTKPLNEITVRDVWRGFEQLYDKQLVRAVGVSNWNPEQIEQVMQTARIPIHNCQVELNVFLPQHELHETCKKYDITMTSYATIGSPGRSQMTLGTGGIIGFERFREPLADPAVTHIAAKYNKTPAQILMKYVLQRGIAVIPKSTKAKRIQENIQLFDFEIEPDDFQVLDTIPYRQRMFKFTFLAIHREDPFKDERKKNGVAKTEESAE